MARGGLRALSDRGTFGLGLALLVSLPTASAFVGSVDDQGGYLRWDLSAADGSVHTNILNPVTHAVRFSIAADAYSSAQRAAELNAVRASFAQWQAVPGTSLKFEEGELLGSGADVNPQDNTNVVYWAKNSTLVNGGLDDIHGALGYTYFDYFNNNTLAEADIVLNGVEFRWSADPNPPANVYFIEGVLLHEIGHLIGLDHSPIGSATMFARGEGGSGAQAGLSTDEIAGARVLYPAATTLASLAAVRGQVTLNGGGVLGAVVVAEDTSGNVVQGTVTRASGQYELLALLPGTYALRVSPLDPWDANRLVAGWDISAVYADAQIGFLPTDPVQTTLNPADSRTMNFSVTAGASGFRVARLATPGADPNRLDAPNAAVTLTAGQSNLFIGVFSPNLQPTDAKLAVTGDSVSLGASNYRAAYYTGLNLVYATISIAPNATPGMRSFVVEQGNSRVYVNGFLEIASPIPDHNFDGLDDRFQRQYFPLWTSLQGAPTANPDGDTMNNLAEWIAGTDPTDPQSYLQFQRILQSGGICTFEWHSAPGKTYQILAQPNLVGNWQIISPRIQATGASTQWSQGFPVEPVQFYRLQALP